MSESSSDAKETSSHSSHPDESSRAPTDPLEPMSQASSPKSKKSVPKVEPDHKIGTIYKDSLALIVGVLGYAVFIAVAMGIGTAPFLASLAARRGWSAMGGLAYTNLTDSDRFDSDQGSWDYLWKLKVIPWLLYATHQIAVWWSIYYAQEHTKTWSKQRVMGDKSRYSHEPRSFNWWALGINALFHVLHLLQTQLQYDALAQDVSISTSQASVIMILVFILLMEWRERGIAFGFPEKNTRNNWAKKFPLTTYPIDLVRAYHGYAFAWGAIYTFWYHPMEGTQAHAMGFILTSMIMLQGSLAFTWAHLNPYWKLLVESWVTAHGTVVAFQTGAESNEWGRFLFGFAWLLAMTQIFTLPFWKKIHKGWRAVPFIIYVAAVIGSYSYIKDSQGRAWVRMWEVTNIPLVEYAFAGITFLVMLFVTWLVRLCGPSIDWEKPSTLRRIFSVLVPMGIVFIIDSLISMAFHVTGSDRGSDLIVYMIIFSLLFLLLSTIYMLIGGFCSRYPFHPFDTTKRNSGEVELNA